MPYKNWSAMDMALILELALQKDGDTQSNVHSALTNLSDKSKVWKRGDEGLGEYCGMLLQMPDPVKSVRDVVDNFYKFLTEDTVFKAEVEVSEEVALALTEPEIIELESAYREIVIDDMVGRMKSGSYTPII